MEEAAKSVPIATEYVADGAPEVSDADSEWRILDTLGDRERRFVRHALLGKDLNECARIAGTAEDDGVMRMLGRPRVRAALEQLVPYVAAIDPKRAAKLLLPYWLEKLYKTVRQGSDAQSTGAIKELIALAGVNSTRVEHLHASLADVVSLIESRQKSARALPAASVTTVQAREIDADSPDTESVATSDAAIWGDGPSAADPVHNAETVPAPAAKPAKKARRPRRKARGRNPGGGENGGSRGA